MNDLSLKLVINGSNDGALRALNQVVASGKATGATLRQADEAGSFAQTKQGLSSVSTQLARVQTIAAAAFTGGFLVEMAREAVRAVDELKGVESRVKLASSSVAEFQDNMRAIQATANQAGTDIASVGQLFNRIATPIKDMGGSSADAQATIQMVGNALRVSGATASESASAMLQFTQAMGAGVLRGEELNSILENAPRLAQAIASGLGVTVGQLKALGEQGALTSQQVYKALQSQQAQLAEEAARLPQTVGMAWTNLAEAIKVYESSLDKSTGMTGTMAAAINAVASNVPAVAAGFETIAIGVGAAFGANRVAAISSFVQAQRTQISTNQIAAADNLKLAESELAVAQAVQRKAAEELKAITVTTDYLLMTNAAASAEQRRAAAAALSTANQNVVTSSMAVAEAKTAATAASVGLMGRAFGAVTTAGRGLLALFGGPWGLLVTAITVGAAAWDLFGKKAKKAEEDNKVSVSKMIQDYSEFSAKTTGENAINEQLTKLRGRAEELRNKLYTDSGAEGFRRSDEGKAAQEELDQLDKKVSQEEERIAKASKDAKELIQQKSALGVSGMSLGVEGLISADSQTKLKAFDDLYKAFSQSVKNENGSLKVSALEARAALDALFAAAKTPAEFTAVIGRLETAISTAPKNSRSAYLQSMLESAIEQRSQAEQKALEGLVSGLEARAKRVQSLFAATATVALGQFNQAAALARVAAELNNDVRGGSRIDIASRNADLAQAKQAANLQLAAADQVAARKRSLIDEQTAAIKAQAQTDIDTAAQAKEANIAAFQKEVDEGKRTAGELTDYRNEQQKAYQEKVASAVAARGQAEANGARQIRQVDAETAQQRAQIAQDLYGKLQAKSADALAAYKGYAQEVIALDKQIASNRLDTASAINAIARKDMTPKQQADNIRGELANLKAETSDALNAGQRDRALELLNRQKSMASELANVSGDGVDQKKMRQEAMATLSDIGGQANAVLQEQRDAAAAAAAEQLAQYQQMTQAMNTLASQIVALNEQSAIKLKPEIDKASLDGAIAAVQQAFQGLIIPVKVQAVGLPNTVAPEGQAQLPEVARAYGGPLPGTAPHDRADNMLYWGTPGEWVIQRPAVRYYGAEWLAAINAMRLPRHAFGGQLGNSVLSRISIPSMPAAQGGASGTPVVLDMGFLGRYSVTASKDTQESLVKAVSSAARRFGRN